MVVAQHGGRCHFNFPQCLGMPAVVPLQGIMGNDNGGLQTQLLDEMGLEQISGLTAALECQVLMPNSTKVSAPPVVRHIIILQKGLKTKRLLVLLAKEVLGWGDASLSGSGYASAASVCKMADCAQCPVFVCFMHMHLYAPGQLSCCLPSTPAASSRASLLVLQLWTKKWESTYLHDAESIY